MPDWRGAARCLFTCDQSRGARGPPREARPGGGRLSHRRGEAIVPGRGGGQAAALRRGSHRPIQAGDQKQRRQEEQRQRRQAAVSSGHGETESRLKDMPNREGTSPGGGERGPAGFVLITKASSPLTVLRAPVEKG